MAITFIRTILLYLLIVFSVRLMGKRQIGQLQPSELVITILISNIATLPIENLDLPLLGGIIPILVLISLEVIISTISLRSKKFRSMVSGNPIIIIQNGKIDQKALKKLRFSTDDLIEELRVQQIFDVSEVEFAMVETSGKLSVYQKFQSRTVTAEMLSLDGEDGPPPQVVVSEGSLNSEAMEVCRISEEWIAKTLLKERISLSNVFLMVCDKDKQYTITRKDAS